MYTIVVRQTVDNDLLKKWKTLWNQSNEGHFFNTPEWFFAACDVYHIKQFRIITIEDNAELVLVLPLIKKKVFGIPVWTYVGGKFVSKSSLLIKEIDKRLLQELAHFLMRHGDFYLPELNQEIAEVLCDDTPCLIKKEASVNLYLPISPDPFCFLSSKNRSQIRSILRKNKKDISFKTFTGDRKTLEAVFELDMRSSKKRQGKATFVTQDDKGFFRKLLQRMPKSFVIDFVYHQDKPIIYSIGFTYKNIFHASHTAFDAEYRFLRPGKLLAHYRIEKLQKEKFDLLDFGRGNSALKREFTNLANTQYSVFFIFSPLSKSWLLSTQRVYDGILQSKPLYTSYLFLKKHLLY